MEEIPSGFYGYKELANRLEASANFTATAGQAGDFAAYIDGLLERTPEVEQQVVVLTEHSSVFGNPHASGTAYTTENMAFVENNFEYSTAAVSHEILHLVLKEQGHDRSCYSDKIHENQFAYELKEMGKNKHPIVKRFDC